MRKSFLGRGLSFPFAVDGQGRLRMSEEERSIEQSLLLILGTAPGERVMRPDFGCEIHDYVFRPNNATTASLVSYYARESLVKWEPRVDNVRVKAFPDQFQENLMKVEITYRVIRTNDLKNLVYPFYLRREEDL